MKNKSYHSIFIHHLKTNPIFDWAATLAYYFMLSIFPLLIFLLALIPYFQFDVNTIHAFINDYLPEEIAEHFSTTILEVISVPQGGLISFGILAAIWSASNGVNALIRAVNRSYNIEETRHFIKVRLLSIFLTIGFILVIVVTLLLPVFGDLIITGIDTFFLLPPETIQFLNMLRWVIGISFMCFVLMFIYWIAPNVNLRCKDVIIGALTATVGWQVISLAFSAYVSNFANFTATYGSLGGVIILMLWFFLTGFILIIGGMINATFYIYEQETIHTHKG